MLASRGLIVSREWIHLWCLKINQTYANALRRQLLKRGDKWPLDEVYLIITGTFHDLWLAIDQDGQVLDILVQNRRARQVANRRLCKRLKRLNYRPCVMITDKLKSYAAATRDILPRIEHRQHKRLNHWAEGSSPTEKTTDASLQIDRPRVAFSDSYTRYFPAH